MESNQSNPENISLKHKMPKNRKRAGLLIVLFAAFIALAIVVVAVFFVISSTKQAKFLPCSSDAKGNIKSQIKEEFVIDNKEKLNKLSETVKSQKNYSSDANCLIVLISNEVANNDYDKATAYLKDFEKIKPETYQVNEIFRVNGILKAEDLKNNIEFIKIQQENYKNNTLYF